jgi:hypothetical protein
MASSGKKGLEPVVISGMLECDKLVEQLADIGSKLLDRDESSDTDI